MKTLIETDEFLSEHVRLEKTLMKRESPDEFPELMKWKIQMLYFDGENWVRICRIDNYPHEGQHGSHIHTYGNEQVRRTEANFQDAYGLVKDIGARILQEKFGHDF
ncbi:hypothetical protein HZB90_04255 [archaeon]|nr:hypothetical protein [archaeon]